MRARLWAGRAAAGLGGLAITVVVLELAVRVVPSDLPAAVRRSGSFHDLYRIVRYDPDLRFSFVPDARDFPLVSTDFTFFHVSTDRLGSSPAGFRARFDEPRAFGVVLGDSFAMGWGVEQEESFPAVLEELTGRSFKSFGLPAYGPQQAEICLRDLGTRLEPQVVLWQLFANDFADAVNFEDWVAAGALRAPPLKSALNRWFLRTSCCYKLYKHLTSFRSSRRAHWQGEGVEYLFTYGWQGWLDLEDPRMERGLQLVRLQMERLVEFAAERGFEPVILTIPPKEVVYYDEWAGFEGHAVAPRESLELPYRLLLEHARDVGLRALDLTPALRQAKAGQIYLFHDGHLSALGQRVVGERLAEYLAAEGLLE